MDYSRPELVDRLASEYVLGTLQGRARTRFEQLLPAHPALRAAVHEWQARLTPLSDSVAEVKPSAAVWPRIEAQLFGAPAAAPTPTPWWRQLGLWRGLAGLATTAALAMALLINQAPLPAPAQAPIIIVLGANPEAAGALNASFVASVSADGRALVLKPLNDLALAPDRALQLWAVPPQGAPRSLGLVQSSGDTRLLQAQLLANTAAFAVSVEPAGGSPTGAPTGPIVSVGKLQL